MKITDWIRGLLRDGQYRPGYRELQELSEKAKRAAGVYNHEELSGLIHRYRRSDEAVERIALAIAKSEPFHSPVSTVYRHSIEMMEALNDTRFMEKHGHRLSDIAPEDATPIHRLLAKYTFMLDAELKECPTRDMERPPCTEVVAATGILDYRWQKRDVYELCELASYGMVPSEYVRIRYGLEQVCSDYSYLEEYIRAHEYGDIELDAPKDCALAKVRMCLEAEKAVENIPGVRLPDFYLENLDHELGNLGRIAISPDAVNDLIHVGPDFLIKYGIDKNAPSEDISRQAQKAYCELDARFVRMTGRRPYAEGLLASLRQKPGNTTADKVRPQQTRRNHIRNPPPSNGKGRKPSL